MATPGLGKRTVQREAVSVAASDLATKTCVSAINLHQCPVADLNPYNMSSLSETQLTFEVTVSQMGT